VRAVNAARDLRAMSGKEIRLARLGSGISQRDASRAAGMSASQYGRIERAELRQVTLEQLCRASSAVGLRATLRYFPDSDPIRDAAQARLLARLHSITPPTVRWRMEVPIHREGDLRSWDAVLGLVDVRVAVEAESRVRDAQATTRRALTKLRDHPTIDHLVLLVADTVANRRAIELVRELLRQDFPLETRHVLAALRAGRDPGASGIVFL
jgi:transcriptional regulator with XRE-family HTH domain